MQTVGVICEYNPFHLGHARQLGLIRQQLGQEAAIVCLMSGNYVQRGEPAVFDKCVRARAAVEAGASLVLELPVTYALRSAEGFAAGGVSILSRLGCGFLSFGCESGDGDAILRAAEASRSSEFEQTLHANIQTGLSYAAARQRALEALGQDGQLLTRPNDILAFEYCRAILTQNSPMHPLAVLRPGDYHADTPDAEHPSATAVRAAFWQGRYGQANAACGYVLPTGPVCAPDALDWLLLYKLRMADVQALEQAVQEEENAAIIATVRKFELSPEELALALEELRHNVVAPSLEAKAKQDKEQMEEEETDEEAELPQD